MADDPYTDDRDDERVGDDRDEAYDEYGDDYDETRIDDDGYLVEDDYPEDETDDYRDGEVMRAEATEDESWWDEGLIGTLLLVGLVLFLFPEPATSGLGIALMAVGAVLWLFDWFA